MALKIVVRKLITELGYEVNEADLIRYRAQIAALKGDVTGVGGQVAGAWQDANGKWRDASGKFVKGMNGGLQQANANAQQLGGTFTALKGIIGGVLGGLIVGGVSMFLRKTIEVGAETQQLKSRLETLLGPEKAVEKFKELQRFAAETPYQLAEITDAFIRLEGAGFDMSEKNMTALGDLSAASNVSMSKMAEVLITSGRGSADMVDSFQGLSAVSKGGALHMERLNKATGELIKKTVDPKNKKDLLAFYVEAGQAKGVKDGMMKLSKTLGGMWSTLKDNVDAFFRTVGEEGVNEALQEVIGLLSEGVGGGESLAKTIGKGLALAVRGLGAALRFAKDHADELRWVLRLFALNRLGLAIGLVTLAIWPLIAAFTVLGLAMIPIMVPMGIITLGLLLLGLAVEDLYYFLTGGKSVIGDFVDELMKLGGVQQMVAWFQRAARVWGAVFRILGMVAAGVFDRAQGAWMGFTAAVGAGFDRMLSGGRDALKWLAEAFGLEFGGIEDNVGAVFEHIDAWIAGLLDKLDAFAGPLAKLAGVDVGAIKRELDIIKGVPGAGANAGAIGAANARGIANGVTNMATNVGSVTVQVAGSTGMGPSDLAGATEKGVRKGVAGPLRAAQ